LDGSVSVCRFIDFQSQLSYDIAQQAPQIGIVLNHQHQFSLMVVLNAHVFIPFGWRYRPFLESREQTTLMPRRDLLIVHNFRTGSSA
jgi:uncharacterized protein YbdZ (MbtH family)